MNVKKIIKGVIGLGAMGGIAYAAYKLGEKNGEVNERFRQKYDVDDDEELDNYYGSCFEKNNYVEPDDGCIAPVEKPKFAPLNSVHVDSVPFYELSVFLADITDMDYISNRFVRDELEVDSATADNVLNAFVDAGYIGNENGCHRYPVLLSWEEYKALRK